MAVGCSRSATGLSADPLCRSFAGSTLASVPGCAETFGLSGKRAMVPIALICMSISKAEFDLLRAEVLSLQSELIRLRARVAVLEEEKFELVESRSSTTSAAASTSLPPPRPSAPEEVSRGEVCKRVGEFLRRCLQGGHRCTSSRDLLPLASRFWIVIRTITWGVFSKFGACKALVKRGSEAGDSIFVDLPAQWDVNICLRGALLSPFRLRDEWWIPSGGGRRPDLLRARRGDGRRRVPCRCLGAPG